jgi:hypothetical protein
LKGKKYPKTFDAKKLQRARPDAGPLLRRPTAPDPIKEGIADGGLDWNPQLIRNPIAVEIDRCFPNL